MTRPHGYARYRLDGCRCYVCGWARSEYDDNRTRALIAGTWQPWVDAEPVRIHIRYLQSCDMGLRTIAARAGVDRKRLQAVLNGRPERGTPPQKKLRPALAVAILQVEATLDALAGMTVISALGTVRRLRALVAVGWPQQHIAAAMGWTPSNFGQLLRADAVIVHTARLVQDVYDRLYRTDPAKHGATPVGMERAGKRAAALHWAPVGAWDDDTIDDPEAFPGLDRQLRHPPGLLGAPAHHRPGLPALPGRLQRLPARAQEPGLRPHIHQADAPGRTPMSHRPYPHLYRALAQVERGRLPKPPLCPLCKHPVSHHASENGRPVCTRGQGLIACRDCAELRARTPDVASLIDFGRAIAYGTARRYLLVEEPRRTGEPVTVRAVIGQAVEASQPRHVATRRGMRCDGGVDHACTLLPLRANQPLVLARAVRTCEALPSQWNAWTVDGQYLYLRYRSGIGTVDAYDTEDSEQWTQPPEGRVAMFDTGSYFDGDMDLPEFCERAGLELAADAEVIGE